MANRSDGRKFLSTGRPPDKAWMESGQRRPSWGGEGASVYNGFGNGINGKQVWISTTPVREAQASCR